MNKITVLWNDERITLEADPERQRLFDHLEAKMWTALTAGDTIAAAKLLVKITSDRLHWARGWRSPGQWWAAKADMPKAKARRMRLAQIGKAVQVAPELEEDFRANRCTLDDLAQAGKLAKYTSPEEVRRAALDNNDRARLSFVVASSRGTGQIRATKGRRILVPVELFVSTPWRRAHRAWLRWARDEHKLDHRITKGAAPWHVFAWLLDDWARLKKLERSKKRVVE